MLTDGEPNNTRVQNDPFRNVPPRRRKNLDWITCEIPPDDLTPFEKFTREVDWENSFFGPISSWDEQLRSAVLICLADPEPAALLWGDKQHMIYNEGRHSCSYVNILVLIHSYSIYSTNWHHSPSTSGTGTTSGIRSTLG